MCKRIWFTWAISAVALLTPAAAFADEAEDSATAARIAANMKQSGLLQGYRIGVTCSNGEALLEGDVTSNEQGVIALQIARETEGVTEVVNHLMCQAPEQPATASGLANRLKSALSSRRGEAQLTSSQAPAETPAMAPPFAQQPAAQQPLAATRSAALPRHSQHQMQQRQMQMQQMQMQQQMAALQQQTPYPYRQTAALQPAPAAPLAAVPTHGATVGIGGPTPAYVPGAHPAQPAQYDQPYMPNYSWPSYAANPNYAAVTYPKQNSPTAWPYIGPFYPYPQVPLGWRKVTLEWDDGWWMLDFKD